jgi:DNA-binding beta-propeller fold protein YncE
VDFRIDYKFGLAVSQLDGYLYTGVWNGQIVRFDPRTRVGEWVANGPQPTATSYLAFDPYHPNILYIAYLQRHAIYTFDLNTKEFTLFAGTPGRAGYKDGPRLEAEFNSPQQMVVDSDGSLVFAEETNHCIRKISPDGLVTTVIGIGGVAGYVDGNPEDALFDAPRGIAIDKDYTIYIADWNNNVVRKLTVQ